MTEQTQVNTQEELVKQFQIYIEENQKFTDKKVKGGMYRAKKLTNLSKTKDKT